MSKKPETRAAYKARIAASKAAIDSDLSRLVPNALRDRLTPAEFVSVVRRALGVAITSEYAQELLKEVRA